jgi:UDP-N-acetylmuramoyl-L-alanyl-D-glutamate--2,6-diaminopimelate ligase
VSAAWQRLDSPPQAARWLRRCGAVALVTDHREAAPGRAFLAWPGARHDARRHLAEALRAGAPACLAEADGSGTALETPLHEAPYAARLALVHGLKAHVGEIADAFHGRPSERVQVIAATGTNGKTSISWWIAQAEAALGARCGVIGTLGIGEPPHAMAAGTLTTPDAVRVHEALADFERRGLARCAIEASSIGIVEHRLAGLKLEIAAFTNLTQDHLDYHGTMAAYWAAKRSLFDWPGLRAAVVNVDDDHGRALDRELAARPGLERWPVALLDGRGGPEARLVAADVRHDAGTGLAFTLRERATPGGATVRACPVSTAVVGRFNVHNLLVVAGVLRALGHPLDAVAQALGAVQPVPGRLQRVEGAPDAPTVVVDYAHTPDAIEQVLAALRPLAQARGGRLWCVVGCGGNRDAGKRPLMAARAEAGADHLVLTSDNPRDEPPRLILAHMASGLANPDAVRVIEDRRAAIAQVVQQAEAADVVLLAGKGHEATQEIAGVKHPFSDLAEAKAALEARARRAAGRPAR